MSSFSFLFLPSKGGRIAFGYPYSLLISWVVVALTVLWSGVQKLGGTGSGLLLPLVHPLAAALDVGPARVMFLLNALAGLAEVGAGAGLLVMRTRRVAVVAVLVIHALTLAALGALGARTNLVLWPWTLGVAAAAVALFGGRHSAALPGWREVLAPRQGVPHAAALLLTGILPALSLAGHWDAYLSAALYSGNSGSAYVQWSAEGGEPGPVPARHAQTDPRPPGRALASLPAWAIGELRAPAYPAERVARQLARQLCRRANPAHRLTLVFRRRLTLPEVMRAYLARRRGEAQPMPERVFTCEML